jgi:diguanylate cyclase (GGDEF)-like protein
MHHTVTAESRNPLFKLGVRQKVVLILVTVLLSALTISGWLSLEHEKNDTLHEIQERATDITRLVSESLAYSVVGYDYHTIQLLLDEITMSDIVEYAKVVSVKGNIMAESGSLKVADSPESVMFTKNIMLDGEKVGVLSIGISTTSNLRRLNEEKIEMIANEVLVILLIAAGEFFALSILIIKPVRIMSEALRDSVRKNGEKMGTLPVISNDEFGDLARQFNALSAELNDANDRLRTRVVHSDEQLRETNKKLLQQSKELREMSKEFERLSITDALTGLYNRRHFEATIEAKVSASIRYDRASSLLLIDIDHFKKINDTYGHSAGDMVLREMARRLKRRMRNSDTLCRIGGEEFAVICENAGKDEALNIAEKLRMAVWKGNFDIDRELIHVSVSVGVATIPDGCGTATAKDFHHCADIALYQSKSEGRNCVTHYTSCGSLDQVAK